MKTHTNKLAGLVAMLMIAALAVGSAWAQPGAPDEAPTPDQGQVACPMPGGGPQFGAGQPPFGGPEGAGRGGFGPGARGRGEGGPDLLRMLTGPKAVEELGLTEEQVDKIEAIQKKHERDEIDVDAELRKAQLDMRDLMQADTLDRDAIMAAIDKASALRTQKEKLNVGSMLDARDVLSADQQPKLKELRKDFRKNMRERMGDKRGEGKKGEGLKARKGERGKKPAPGQEKPADAE